MEVKQVKEQKETPLISDKKNLTSLHKTPMTFKAMISIAILSSTKKKMTLAEIYRFISEEFPEFTTARAGWKNTVRHNLSIHECFIKGELAPPGKSCYWRIHKGFAKNFSRGDFSRRSSKIVNKFKPKRFERWLDSIPDQDSSNGIIHRECNDFLSQTLPRFQTQTERPNDYLTYSAWRIPQEQTKRRLVLETIPFYEGYYYDHNQLGVSFPYVVDYDEYILPGRFHCTCNDCQE